MPHQILFGAWEYNLRDEQTLFGEVRARVGGTTSLLSTREPGLYTTAGRLVRNLEHEPSPSGRIEATVSEDRRGLRERAGSRAPGRDGPRREDVDFFERLRAAGFPFTATLEEVYRPFAR